MARKTQRKTKELQLSEPEPKSQREELGHMGTAFPEQLTHLCPLPGSPQGIEAEDTTVGRSSRCRYQVTVWFASCSRFSGFCVHSDYESH